MKNNTLMGKKCMVLVFTLAVELLLFMVVSRNTVAQTQAQSLGNEYGLFVVENALDQFNNLKHHGEALGWRNPESLGAPDPSLFNHYQGLARYPGVGVPVFYVTQKSDDGGGYLHVVRFGTRPTNGERLRSNLQSRGSDTEETYPEASDTWIKSIRFDGSLLVDGILLPVYVHPGSMAIVDDILFVPLDTPVDDNAAIGQIVLFDLSQNAGGPLNPTPIQAIELDHPIDNLAVTRLEDGKYLLFTNGDGGAVMYFKRTTSSDLRYDGLNLENVQDFNTSMDYDSNGKGDWPTGSGAHQSSTFLREPDGSLYLIGMRHNYWSFEDWADLYRVEYISGRYKLTALANRHMYCVYDGGGGPSDMRICHFAAANNAYVSPSGELILYSIPHDDEDGFDPDIVRLAEFRHRDVTRESSPLRRPIAYPNGPYSVEEGGEIFLNGNGSPPSDRPWVELYDDDNWRDRSIVVDYDDREKLELNNFNNLDNFNDKTTSIRWRSPIGLDIELYDDDNFRDRYIILRGTGKTEYISHLNSQVVVPGVVEHPGKDAGERLEFNDKTSSMRFVGTAPTYGQMILEWDLDGDGIFETTGLNPVFSALEIDGPAQVTISLRARNPGDPTGFGISEPAATFIQVNNVAPTANIDFVHLPNPHFILPRVHQLAFGGSFSDPGCLDVHTATWDFGDETILNGNLTEENNPPYATGTTTANHIYSHPGTYNVTLIITDDDGGSGTDTIIITVVDERGALQDIKAHIQGLPDSAFKKPADQRKNALAMKLAGIAFMFEKGSYNGAIKKLRNDVRTKCDGLVDGDPNNDWITDHHAQEELCKKIDDLVSYLAYLINH